MPLVPYLVLLVDAAGEGNPTGLHTGVGIRTQKVDVSGPVFEALHSTTLKLQTGNYSSHFLLDGSPFVSHLLLDEVNSVLQIAVLPVADNRPHHQLLCPLHHLNDSTIRSSHAQRR